MLVRNIIIEAGAVIRVGDVTLTLMKAGERRVRVGVSAPPDTMITTSGSGHHPPVDTHPQDMVGDS